MPDISSDFSTATFRYNVIDESGCEYRSKTGLGFAELLADVEYMATLVVDSDAKSRGYMPEAIIASLKRHDFAGGFAQWIGNVPSCCNGYFRKIVVTREPNKDGGLR